jgi:hypothetical protein
MVLINLDSEGTLIKINHAEHTATIITNDKKMIKRLQKLYSDSKNKDYIENGNVIAEEYIIDSRMISFRTKLPEAHPLTEEQRKARSERMKAFRAKQLAEKKGGC